MRAVYMMRLVLGNICSRENFKTVAPASIQARPILPEFLKRSSASAHLAKSHCLAARRTAALPL